MHDGAPAPPLRPPARRLSRPRTFLEENIAASRATPSTGMIQHYPFTEQGGDALQRIHRDYPTALATPLEEGRQPDLTSRVVWIPPIRIRAAIRNLLHNHQPLPPVRTSPRQKAPAYGDAGSGWYAQSEARLRL